MVCNYNILEACILSKNVTNTLHNQNLLKCLLQQVLNRVGDLRYDLINENPFGPPAPAVDANLDDGAAFPFVEAASDDEDD